MSTTVNHSRVTHFVADHAGKAMFGGFVGAVVPGTVVAGSLFVSFVTRGRVNPANFFFKPHVAKAMEQFTKGSVKVCAASAVLGGSAEYLLRVNYSAHTFSREKT